MTGEQVMEAMDAASAALIQTDPNLWPEWIIYIMEQLECAARHPENLQDDVDFSDVAVRIFCTLSRRIAEGEW